MLKYDDDDDDGNDDDDDDDDDDDADDDDGDGDDGEISFLFKRNIRLLCFMHGEIILQLNRDFQRDFTRNSVGMMKVTKRNWKVRFKFAHSGHV